MSDKAFAESLQIEGQKKEIAELKEKVQNQTHGRSGCLTFFTNSKYDNQKVWNQTHRRSRSLPFFFDNERRSGARPTEGP